MASNVITVDANLTNYALLTDLSTKQDTLLASATGTPLLNGSVLRSISAGKNVSLALQDNNITVSVPYVIGNNITTPGTTTLTSSIFGGYVTVSGVPPFTPYTITLPLSGGCSRRAVRADVKRRDPNHNRNTLRRDRWNFRRLGVYQSLEQRHNEPAQPILQ